jgi:Domain of unknown function (DUF4214)
VNAARESDSVSKPQSQSEKEHAMAVSFDPKVNDPNDRNSQFEAAQQQDNQTRIAQAGSSNTTAAAQVEDSGQVKGPDGSIYTNARSVQTPAGVVNVSDGMRPTGEEFTVIHDGKNALNYAGKLSDDEVSLTVVTMAAYPNPPLSLSHRKPDGQLAKNSDVIASINRLANSPAYANSNMLPEIKQAATNYMAREYVEKHGANGWQIPATAPAALKPSIANIVQQTQAVPAGNAPSNRSSAYDNAGFKIQMASSDGQRVVQRTMTPDKDGNVTYFFSPGRSLKYSDDYKSQETIQGWLNDPSSDLSQKAAQYNPKNNPDFVADRFSVSLGQMHQDSNNSRAELNSQFKVQRAELNAFIEQSRADSAGVAAQNEELRNRPTLTFESSFSTVGQYPYSGTPEEQKAWTDRLVEQSNAYQQEQLKNPNSFASQSKKIDEYMVARDVADQQRIDALAAQYDEARRNGFQSPFGTSLFGSGQVPTFRTPPIPGSGTSGPFGSAPIASALFMQPNVAPPPPAPSFYTSPSGLMSPYGPGSLSLALPSGTNQFDLALTRASEGRDIFSGSTNTPPRKDTITASPNYPGSDLFRQANQELRNFGRGFLSPEASRTDAPSDAIANGTYRVGQNLGNVTSTFAGTPYYIVRQWERVFNPDVQGRPGSVEGDAVNGISNAALDLAGGVFIDAAAPYAKKFGGKLFSSLADSSVGRGVKNFFDRFGPSEALPPVYFGGANPSTGLPNVPNGTLSRPSGATSADAAASSAFNGRFRPIDTPTRAELSNVSPGSNPLARGDALGDLNRGRISSQFPDRIETQLQSGFDAPKQLPPFEIRVADAAKTDFNAAGPNDVFIVQQRSATGAQNVGMTKRRIEEAMAGGTYSGTVLSSRNTYTGPLGVIRADESVNRNILHNTGEMGSVPGPQAPNTFVDRPPGPTQSSMNGLHEDAAFLNRLRANEGELLPDGSRVTLNAGTANERTVVAGPITAADGTVVGHERLYRVSRTDPQLFQPGNSTGVLGDVQVKTTYVADAYNSGGLTFDQTRAAQIGLQSFIEKQQANGLGRGMGVERVVVRGTEFDVNITLNRNGQLQVSSVYAKGPAGGEARALSANPSISNNGANPIITPPPVRSPALEGLPDTLRLNTNGPRFPLIGGARPGRAFDPSNLPLSATAGEFTASNPLAALQENGGRLPNADGRIPDWYVNPRNYPDNYETQKLKGEATKIAENRSKEIPFDPSPIVAQGVSIFATGLTAFAPNNMAPIRGPVGPILTEYLANPSAFNRKYVNNGLPNTIEPWLVDNATGKTTIGAAPSLYDAVKGEALANGYTNAKQSSFYVNADGKVMVSAIDPGGVKRDIELVLPASSLPLGQQFKLEPYNTLTANPTEPGQYGKIGATFTVNGGPLTSATDIGVNLNRTTTPTRADVNVLKLDQTSPALTQGLFYKQTNHISANALTATESYPGRSLVMDPTRPKVSALSGFVTEGFERTRFNGVGGSLAVEHTGGAEGASLNRVSLTAPDGAAIRLTGGQQFFGGQIRQRAGNVASPLDFSPDPANMLFLQLRGQAGTGVPPPGVDGLPVVESPEPGRPLLRLFEPGVKTDVLSPKKRAAGDSGADQASSTYVSWNSGGVPDNPFIDLASNGDTRVSYVRQSGDTNAFLEPMGGLSDSSKAFLPPVTQYIANGTSTDGATANTDRMLSDLGIEDVGQPINGPIGDRVAELAADAKRWKQTGKDLTAAGGLLGNLKDPMAQAGATLLKGIGDELSSGQMTDQKPGNAATGIAGAFIDAAGKTIGGNFGSALSAAGTGLKEFGDNNVNGVNGDGAVGAIATVANIANQLGGGEDPVLGATATIASGVSESMRLGAKGAGAGEELAALRAALAAEPDEQKRIGLQAEIKDKAAEEKAYRDAQGNTTRTAIADGIGAAVGGSTGAIISKVDDVIDVANRTTTDGVPDNAGFAIGGAIASAVGDATKNPTLSGLGAVSTRISNVMELGTGAAKYGQLAASEIAKNFSVDADGDPIPIPQSNQQIIDFAQTKEAQLRGQQSGATVDAIGLGVQTLGQVTGSKEIALAGQATSIAGNIISLDNNGIKGDAAAFGVSTGTKLLGTAVGGEAGKIITAGGGLYQGVTQIAKGGFANVMGGAGAIASIVGGVIGGGVGKALDWGGTIATAIANPIAGGIGLAMKFANEINLFGTRKGKMGNDAQVYEADLNADNLVDRVRRDNDNDIFIDQGQADGSFTNVVRFNNKGFFDKASQAADLNVADLDGDGKYDVRFKGNQYLNRSVAGGGVSFVDGAQEAAAKAQAEQKARFEAAPLFNGAYAVAGDSDGTPTWSFTDKDGVTVKGPGGVTYEDQIAQGWVGVDQGGGNFVRVATASLHYGNRGWKTLVVNNPAIDANMSAATTAATTAQQKQWVSDIYYQELGRPVDAPSATNWELMFANGTATTDSMRGALRNTPEGQSYANAQTTLAYREVLGREPDPLGLATWAGQITSGAFTVAQVRAGLASSAEGQARLAIQASVATPLAAATAPTASAQQQQWVSDIYYQELGRGVDPEAATNWGAMFANGSATIESMRSALRASPEGGNYATTQTIQAYREVLGREPDEGGLANNAALIRSGTQTVEQMRAALTSSAEGQARVATQAIATAQAAAPTATVSAAAEIVIATVTAVPEPVAAVSTEPQAQPTVVQTPVPAPVESTFDVPAIAPPLVSPPLPIAAQVVEAYREFLNREPEAEGLANNVALVTSGTQTIEQVRANLASSNEAKINKAYRELLGYRPDAGGLQYWWGLMQSGQLNETQLRDSFAQISNQQKAA